MYCINCGNEIPDGQTKCPSCNATIESKVETPVVNTPIPAQVQVPVQPIINTHATMTPVNNLDKSTKGIALLGFFLFPIGIIFYFLSKKDTPVRAKTALQGAIFGIITFSVAALIFIYLVLPVVKRYALKYQCVTYFPGAYYNYQTFTCHKPDGSETTLMLQE